MKPRARILVVEDHPIVRRAIGRFLGQEADLEVRCFAADAHSALIILKEQKPDMAIVDISMETDDGLDLIKEMRAQDIQAPVLVFSMHEESIYAERALRAGAQGYIMKSESTSKLVEAVRQVLAGGIYLSESVKSEILLRRTGAGQAGVSPFDLLTDRELQVFRLIGQGRSTREIAEDFHRSVKTIEAHRENLKMKLGLENSIQLVRCAVQWTTMEARACCPTALPGAAGPYLPGFSPASVLTSRKFPYKKIRRPPDSGVRS